MERGRSSGDAGTQFLSPDTVLRPGMWPGAVRAALRAVTAVR